MTVRSDNECGYYCHCGWLSGPDFPVPPTALRKDWKKRWDYAGDRVREHVRLKHPGAIPPMINRYGPHVGRPISRMAWWFS